MPFVLVLLSLFLSCVHAPVADPTPPKPVAKTGSGREMSVQFAPDTPDAEMLWVCGKVDGEFWCVDLQTFSEHLAAKSKNDLSL